MGRKRTLAHSDIFVVDGASAKCILQQRSLRRLIVQFIIDHGGKAELAQINEHFKLDMRTHVAGLMRVGWLIKEGAKS